MTSSLFLAIDAGTSLIKVTAIDGHGQEVDTVSRRNQVAYDRNGMAEQDMHATWTLTVEALGELVARMGQKRSRITAVTVTGQGDGTWLIDRDGNPVGSALTWLDGRCSDVLMRLRQNTEISAFVFKRTRSAFVNSLQSVQLIWLNELVPDRLDRAATAFHCKDWLYFNLTGERVTDITEACINFGDISTRSYDEDIFDFLDLAGRRDLIPPLIDGTVLWHPLLEPAASAIGLHAGTPVVLASQDVVCTGIGAGLPVLGQGTGCSIFGSTGVHMTHRPIASATPVESAPSGYIQLLPGGTAGFRIESHLAGTLNFDWILELAESAAKLLGYANGGIAVSELLDRALSAERVRPVLYHPYINSSGERGPFVDPYARASFNGLTQETTFADLVAGVTEGLALAAYDCYDAIGDNLSAIRVAGGGAQSRHLREMLANIAQVNVSCSGGSLAALGAACIAAVSIGVAGNLGQAVETLNVANTEIEEDEIPNEELAQHYKNRYRAYSAARMAMPPVWPLL